MRCLDLQIPSLVGKLARILILMVVILTAGSKHQAHAWEFSDLVDIGMAYMTHLYHHELGHQVVADEVNADNHQIQFLMQDKGQYYLGISTLDEIPDNS